MRGRSRARARSGSPARSRRARTRTPSTGSTVDFNGSVAQTVPVGASLELQQPATQRHAARHDARRGDHRHQRDRQRVRAGGTLDNGGFAIAGNAGKALQLAAGDGAQPERDNKQLPDRLHHRHLATTSTVNYAGSGTQTIAAANYGNLTSSGTGARTLASGGTIGIAGTFTPRHQHLHRQPATPSTSTAQPHRRSRSAARSSYNNLTSTTTAGATLAAAITATNVTGNVTVDPGTLDNGGFAIAGNAGEDVPGRRRCDLQAGRHDERVPDRVRHHHARTRRARSSTPVRARRRSWRRPTGT